MRRSTGRVIVLALLFTSSAGYLPAIEPRAMAPGSMISVNEVATRPPVVFERAIHHSVESIDQQADTPDQPNRFGQPPLRAPNGSWGISSQAQSDLIRTFPAQDRTPLPDYRSAAVATYAPARISVPAVGIDAQVVRVGLDGNGRMLAPEGYDEVGWFEPGPLPGESGRVVLAGHVDSPWGPAVFYALDQLRPGDEITVVAADGREYVFMVLESHLYWVDEAPTHEIFRTDGPPSLALITCGGEFDRASAMYLQRRVVYAALVT